MTTKKIKYLIFIFQVLIFSIPASAQHFELGPHIGYGFTNISESTGFFKPAAIGKNVWKSNVGASAIYYLEEPVDESVYFVGLLYRRHTRGSVSRVDKVSEFEIQTNTFGLFGGLAYALGEKFVFYYQVGLGLNLMDNKEYYDGNPNQEDIFDYLDEPADIKSSELTAVYAIGISTAVAQDKITVFFEFNGDTGISDINKSYDELNSHLFGVGLGARYRFSSSGE